MLPSGCARDRTAPGTSHLLDPSVGGDPMSTRTAATAARQLAGGGLNRREFVAAGAGAAALGVLGWSQPAGAQPKDGWGQGQLVHLIPTASHERFLIKVSFKAPLAGKPRLTVNGKPVEGVQTDPKGR